MGHALLIVIVEPDTPANAIQHRIWELMDPFDQKSETGARASLDLPCECTDDGTKAADPGCTECSGTGVMAIAYNPQETFDWYQVGGKWEGDIRGDSAEHTEWSDAIPEELRRSMVRVRDIPPSFIPSAVLTPDSVWHGGGGNEDKDDATWTREQARILSEHPEYIAISIDFHY